MTVRSRSKGRYLKRFSKAFPQSKSRPLNHDPKATNPSVLKRKSEGQIRSVDWRSDDHDIRITIQLKGV